MLEDHRPTVRVVLERLLQPRDLFLDRGPNRLEVLLVLHHIDVERDEAGTLVIQIVRLATRHAGTVKRIGELLSPDRRQRQRLRGAGRFFGFVVSRDRKTWDGGGDEAHGVVPLAPKVVSVTRGNQVARMNNKSRFRRLGVSRADQARPPRLDVVLSVTDIEEAKLLGPVAGGMEPVPLAPVLSIANPVEIAGVRLQPLQIRDRKSAV